MGNGTGTVQEVDRMMIGAASTGTGIVRYRTMKNYFTIFPKKYQNTVQRVVKKVIIVSD